MLLKCDCVQPLLAPLAAHKVSRPPTPSSVSLCGPWSGRCFVSAPGAGRAGLVPGVAPCGFYRPRKGDEPAAGFPAAWRSVHCDH